MNKSGWYWYGCFRDSQFYAVLPDRFGGLDTRHIRTGYINKVRSGTGRQLTENQTMFNDA